jgi:hypothetical protein
MTIELTAPIKTYMDSINGNDIAAMDMCMTMDAHVHDIGEKKHINGIEAVKEWRIGSNDEFQLKSEVTDVEEKHGITIVTAVTSGNFPGSPQLFYYHFSVADGMITNIEIVPGEENV